jgi:hypothetical protein
VNVVVFRCIVRSKASPKREAPVSGQSNKLRELLAMRSEQFTPNDAPKIPVDDELLAALRKEHGEGGRPDLYPAPIIAPEG